MPKQYRLVSTSLIHGPGMFRNIRHMWQTGSKRLAVEAVASGWPTLPLGLVLAYLSGEMEGTLEDGGDTLVFEWGEEEEQDEDPPQGRKLRECMFNCEESEWVNTDGAPVDAFQACTNPHHWHGRV